MNRFCFHLKKKEKHHIFSFFPILKGNRRSIKQSSKLSFSIQVNMFFGPKLFVSSIWPPRSQISYLPGSVHRSHPCQTERRIQHEKERRQKLNRSISMAAQSLAGLEKWTLWHWWSGLVVQEGLEKQQSWPHTAEKEVFQGERNEGEPEARLDEWRPPGTGDHMGGQEKRAGGSVVWDRRDV